MRALPHTGKPTNLHFIYKDCKRKTFNNIFFTNIRLFNYKKKAICILCHHKHIEMRSRVFNL